MKLSIKKLTEDAITPTRANPHDAGLDLYANETVFIPSGSTVKVKTGVSAHILPEYVGLIMDRGSMAAKGLVVGGGVIDAQYSGDLTVVLHNFSNGHHTHPDYFVLEQDLTLYHPLDFPTHDLKRTPIPGYQVKKGDKIAQLVFQKVELPEVQEVSYSWELGRGRKGFGSSGQ